MSELERLTEALEWVDSGPVVVGAKHINALADAARRYADLLTNGQRVQWCEVHQSQVDELDRCWAVLIDDAMTRTRTPSVWGIGSDCRIVPRLLSLYPKEAE